MSVEKFIDYEKLLTTNKGRVLLTSYDRDAKLGNVDDAVHDLDAVNLRQLKSFLNPSLVIVRSLTAPLDINVLWEDPNGGIPVLKYFNSVTSSWTSISSASVSALFTADIPVILNGGRTVGKYTNGTTIPAIGKTAEQVFNDIAQEFINPSIGVSLQSGNLFQKGLPVINVQVNYNTNIGTALVSSRKILRNATVVNNPISNNGSFTHTNQNIIWSESLANRTYSYQVDYSNFTTQTVSTVISFIAPSYYGVGSNTLLNSVNNVFSLSNALPGSQELRTNKSRAGTLFNPNLQRYYFCYPTILGDLSSIIDQNGFNVTAGFTLTTKNITLADGTMELYNIYMSNDDTTQTNFILTFN